MYFSIQNSVGVKEIAYATLKSDNADLTGLSLSSGTLSPAFDAATTAYTASVDNSVTDVMATESTNPGANAVVTGGSSLSVGTNTVHITVTAADGTTTKTYTVTVNRAASDNADLAGLSLSSGTLSPTFDAATTAYTASVDNSVTDVMATESTNPGANAVVTGGSNLSVGTNTVHITVTAADGTTTKTYTVTVNRAAPAPTPPVVLSPVVCTINGVGETAVPPNYDLAGGLCVQKTPVPNASEPAPATADSSGTVDASVQSPAGAAEVVTTSWGPGTFTTPATVTLTPESQNTPVAGGFTVGDTTIQLTVTDGSGTKVTSFLKPIIIHIPAGAVSGVPAYSEDGITWVLIPELSTPSLPDGQPDGYYLNADGSVDIYTRHATLFGLLKDTQAPTAPTLKARVSGNKLYLLLKGAKDNVRVAGYQVLFNGHRLKTTLHGYLVLPARAGRFQVTATDTAGNKSKPSAAVKVVRHKRGFDIVKS
jgi:PKD repeat protein